VLAELPRVVVEASLFNSVGVEEDVASVFFCTASKGPPLLELAGPACF
jgi:hypothetical protein